MSTLTSEWPLSVRVGRWWFQNRSLSPLPLFLLLVILPPDFAPNPTSLAIAVTLVLIGESIRLWAVGYAGSATRTRGDSVPQLVHAGPYRVVRNPLYIGNILLYTACGIAFGFVYLTAFIFIYSVVQYTFIIQFEESILAKTFGTAYDTYRARVNKWFPFSGGIESTPHAFNLKRAIVSEKSTFFSLLGMTLIFFVKY